MFRLVSDLESIRGAGVGSYIRSVCPGATYVVIHVGHAAVGESDYISGGNRGRRGQLLGLVLIGGRSQHLRGLGYVYTISRSGAPAPAIGNPPSNTPTYLARAEGEQAEEYEDDAEERVGVHARGQLWWLDRVCERVWRP